MTKNSERFCTLRGDRSTCEMNAEAVVTALNAAAQQAAAPGVPEAAIKALADYQQADNEGVMVLASRQAIDEVLAYFRAASPTPPAPTGWQTIETAPKDGTEILIWRDGYDTLPIAAWGEWDGDEGSFYGWVLRDPDFFAPGCCQEGIIGWQEDIDDGAMPTHWMPAPPAAEPRERGEG